MRKIHSLVVGGTRGLGAEFVRYFRKQGHIVSVVSRGAFKGGGDKHIFHAQADINEPPAFQAALKKTVDANGRFDNVVLAQRFRGEDPWNGEFSTTVTGTRNAIEFTKGHFHPKGSKSIVVVSSVAGRYFIDDQPVSYHVGKAALEHMVRYYAVALGPQGIRVNAITPCAFIKQESREFYLGNKDIQAFYRAIAPLGRMVTTEDIAHVAGFLCDASSYVTGQTIVLDGGISLLWPEVAAKRFRNPFAKAKKA